MCVLDCFDFVFLLPSDRLGFLVFISLPTQIEEDSQSLYLKIKRNIFGNVSTSIMEKPSGPVVCDMTVPMMFRVYINVERNK